MPDNAKAKMMTVHTLASSEAPPVGNLACGTQWNPPRDSIGLIRPRT